MGFFSFYLYVFDPERHVLSISSEEGPLVSYESYEKKLEELYKDEPFILDGYVEDVKAKKWTFMLDDPFDKTYNPAKAILSHEKYEYLYYDAMLETFEGLIEYGELWLE